MTGQLSILLQLLLLSLFSDWIAFHLGLDIFNDVVVEEILLEAGDSIDVLVMGEDSRSEAGLACHYKEDNVRDSLHMLKLYYVWW